MRHEENGRAETTERSSTRVPLLADRLRTISGHQGRATAVAVLALVAVVGATCPAATAHAAGAEGREDRARPPPQRPQSAVELETLAVAAEQAQNLREAAALWARAVEARTHAPPPAEQAKLYAAAIRATILHRELADYAAALGFGKRALRVAQDLHGERHAEVARAHNELGLVYRTAGDLDAAIEHYERALAIYRQLPDGASFETNDTLHNLGVALRFRGDFERAAALLAESLDRYEKRYGADHAEVAISLSELGRLRSEQGDLAAALGLYERALAMSERALGPEHRVIATRLSNLAAVSASLGDHERALQLVERAARIDRQSLGEGHPNLAFRLNIAGRSRLARGDHGRALADFDAAIAIGRARLPAGNPELAVWLVNRGLALQGLGQPHAALEAVLEGQDIVDRAYPTGHWRQGFARLRLAHARLALDDRGGARRDGAIALQIALAAQVNALEWGAYRLQALVARQDGLAEVAVYWGKQAVAAIQRARVGLSGLDRELQRGFLADKRSAYTELADLLIELGRLPEAEHVMAMLREEEFFDFTLRDARAGAPELQSGPDGPEEAAALARLHELGGQLAAAERELAALRSRARIGLSPAQAERQATLEGRLEGLGRELSDFLAALPERLARARPDRPDHAAEFGERLRPGEARLQYVVARDRLSVIATTPRGRVAHTQAIDAAEVARQVAAFRGLVQRRHDLRAEARELHRLLIAPVERELRAAGSSKLAVAADGVLRYLPFAALHDGRGYLVERFAISTRPDPRSAAAGPGPPREAAGLGLTAPQPGFPQLPAVREELRIVGRAFPRSQTYLDEHFTRERLLQVLSERPAVVHVASHFRFRAGTEIHSYLMLGDGQRISLRELRTEVVGLRGIDLVALSACDTAVGGGRDETGAEVEGLGMLMSRMGAAAVLATLWPIADHGAAPFMQQLYGGAGLAQSGAAGALRQAQRRFLEGRAGARFRHPYFWAGFVVIGDY